MGSALTVAAGPVTVQIEAKLVLSIAESLCEVPGISETDIMILSGYTRQVYHVERELRDSSMRKVRVKTVDGSQVDDAPFVILLTVRAKDNDLGFMQYAARTSVATSRQKLL